MSCLRRAQAPTTTSGEPFFSINSDARNRSVLGRPLDPGRYEPFTAIDFLLYLEKTGEDATGGNAEAISRLLFSMARAGLLQSVGYSSQGFFNQAYLHTAGLPRSQDGGDLWLSESLGAAFVVDRYGKAAVAVVGHDSKGDIHCGSGLVLDDRHVLTCGHVITDMTLDGVLLSSGGPHVESDQALVPIEEQHVSEAVDVGVLELAEAATPLPGMAFRAPRWADSVLTFGYPPVPLSRHPVLTVQSGEIVNPQLTSLHGDDLFLFSATSRPGNSGGPVVASDGRVVGIVVQDLQRQDETEAPFFAGIPTLALHAALSTMNFGHLLNLETWQ